MGATTGGEEKWINAVKLVELQPHVCRVAPERLESAGDRGDEQWGSSEWPGGGTGGRGEGLRECGGEAARSSPQERGRNLYAQA